jgi:hypothetical protein
MRCEVKYLLQDHINVSLVTQLVAPDEVALKLFVELHHYSYCLLQNNSKIILKNKAYHT